MLEDDKMLEEEKNVDYKNVGTFCKMLTKK
jgi:hypothetical protein